MTQQKKNTSPSAWPSLFTADKAHWSDLKDTLSFFAIFFIALFVITVFIFIYSHQVSFSFIQISLLIITLLLGAGMTLLAVRNFWMALFPHAKKMRFFNIISKRLFGIPKSIDLFFRYQFVLVNIIDFIDGSFVLKEHPIYWIGGPALLIVFDGTGLYLQRGNQFSRTLGPGVHFLERYETVKEILDLRTQTVRSDYKGSPGTISGRTKDGIKIQLNLEIVFRVIPAETTDSIFNRKKTKAEKIAEKRFFKNIPVNSGKLEAIRKAAERISVRFRDDEFSEARWHDAVWGTVSGELSKYITKHYIDNLLVFDKKENNETQVHYVNPDLNIEQADNKERETGQLLSEQEREHIRRDINKELKDSTGVTLSSLRIINFQLPEEVEEQRQKMLNAKASSRVLRIKGSTTAEKILIRERIRTDTQKDLISDIADSISEVNPTDFANAIMLSLSIPEDTDQPMLSTGRIAMDTFDTLDYLHEFLNIDRTETKANTTDISSQINGEQSNEDDKHE